MSDLIKSIANDLIANLASIAAMAGINAAVYELTIRLPLLDPRIRAIVLNSIGDYLKISTYESMRVAADQM